MLEAEHVGALGAAPAVDGLVVVGLRNTGQANGGVDDGEEEGEARAGGGVRRAWSLKGGCMGRTAQATLRKGAIGGDGRRWVEIGADGGRSGEIGRTAQKTLLEGDEPTVRCEASRRSHSYCTALVSCGA